MRNLSTPVDGLAGKQVPVKVYLDPQRKKPAVIKTEYGGGI